jgi:hypothetical protein
MAEKSDVKADADKPNPLPLIIGAVVVLGIVAFVVMKKRRPKAPPPSAPALPVEDPCKDLPDWACGTVALLNPLAKTSVDVFKAKAASDLEMARLKQSRY